jgi:GAF domain
MRNPWLAIDVTMDPAVRAREVRRAWEGFFGGSGAAGMREPIVGSWQRCADAGVRPTGAPSPPLLDRSELLDRWDEHPLHATVPLLREWLAEIAEEAQHLIVVADAEGRLLWIEGDARVRSGAADEMSFTEGALWSEDGAGTNAVGTAAALDHAVQVFAAEHFNEVVQRWTCAAAPIHDPAGGLLGVIDLTGRLETAHPHSLALAVTSAHAVEAQLRSARDARDAALGERHLERLMRTRARHRALVAPDGRILLSQPRGWAPAEVSIPAGGGEVVMPGDVHMVAESLGADGAYLLHGEGPSPGQRPPTLELLTLGRDRGLVRLAGREVRLTHRHTEILVLLATSRNGLSTEELALALYGETGKPQTVRSEMFRLRKLLGRWVQTEPYRLTLRVEADLFEVERLLRAGQPREAAQRYPAPLLPRSEAPGIVEAREELDAWVRRATIAADDCETLWAWLQSSSGHDDLPAWKRFLAMVAYHDPRRTLAAGRLAHLREALSLAGGATQLTP